MLRPAAALPLLLLLPLLALAGGTTVPTVEIAQGVLFPRVQLGCCTTNVSASLPHWLALQPEFAAIDTAYGYKDQTQIASVLARANRSRSSVWITSKIPGGLAHDGPCTSLDPKAAAIAMVQADLAQLNVTQIDLMLLHEPCDMKTFRPAPHDLLIWQGLKECLDRGYVRAIGVDRMVAAQVAPLLAHHKPSVLMASMSIGNGTIDGRPAHDEATIKFCLANGIQYNAFGVEKGCPFDNAEIVRLAHQHGVSPSQVCARWASCT